jgi:hypothetical protein
VVVLVKLTTNGAQPVTEEAVKFAVTGTASAEYGVIPKRKRTTTT